MKLSVEEIRWKQSSYCPTSSSISLIFCMTVAMAADHDVPPAATQRMLRAIPFSVSSKNVDVTRRWRWRRRGAEVVSWGFFVECELFAKPAAPLGFHSTAPPLLVRETNTFVRPLESFFTGVVRNRPFWTDLVPEATSSVGRPSCVTSFIDVKRNRPLWTDLVHLGPLFTHETEGPWPNHFRHSHSWKRRSQSKFTSH